MKTQHLAAVATLLLVPAAALAAGPDPSKPTGKNAAVTLETIAGSNVKRVVLSAKAAERLGIETGKVGEQSIVHKQMVSGLVTAAADKPPAAKPGGGGIFGGFAQTGSTAAGAAAVATVVSATHAQQQPGGGPGLGKVVIESPQPPTPATPSARTNIPILGDAWVVVSLSAAEWERLAKDKPARLLPLATRDTLGGDLLAQPSGVAPLEDTKRSMLSLYYIVPGANHGLTLNSRLRVELQISGTEDKRKVVPYSAVYYDGKGAAWVYVNTKPLTFERQRINVERIVGDVAILSGGPAIGTPVVTVGASLLFGTEIFGK
ncbi:hypothetical protein C7T35_22720 [Variovorax sp. WS11]|uniref:hypothetical protein n=1 Tax=Variovorax sp. WS11 TaxID=1105204 RepID=UPI000D0CC711|nr:hypothetical protein [Variovorax sp. WS11]NDZ11783.1 hypothetical protein [Variovorax sp. WS11]PSL82322.1 hypothetical protein C7T35_22720 [Variovorax sp. WS11]